MSAKHTSGIATEVSKSQDWTLGTGTSSRSFEIESWSYVQHKDYQLHLLQKAEKTPLNRPTIPTTESQRLTYYRGYATSVFKTQITYIQQVSFTLFFWTYVLNLIFRTLPMNYVHVFLAAYSPDEHLYTSKMSPFLVGLSWQVVMCGVCQLICSADVLTIYLHYAIMGFVQSNPWNRCSVHAFFNNWSHRYSYCYSIDELINITRGLEVGKRDSLGRTLELEEQTYLLIDANGKKTTFFGAPQKYFRNVLFPATNILQDNAWNFLPYVLLIWVGSGLCYKQLFRTHIWKMLSRFQGALTVMYCGSLLIVLWKIMETGTINVTKQFNVDARDSALDSDYDMLADCMTGPPVIQMLSARSKDPINPGRDSIVISASNSLFYFFKTFANNLIKYYAESAMKVPIIFSFNNVYPIFYNWPYYFYHVLLIGDICSRVFYLLSAIVESLLFVLTYQLTVETVVCEWHWTRRWVATIAISITGIICNVVLTLKIKMFLYAYTTRIATLFEAVVIFWLYPLGRLTDDIYFHNGQPTPKILQISFMIVPFYNFYKLFKFIHGARKRLKIATTTATEILIGMNWMWIPAVVPVILGIFYAILKYLITGKQNWRVLFRPRPDWGPREHVTRQLRKQFDSRDYIGSQASRYLSRHLLSKAQTPTYRLDIRYETAAERRSTVIADSFKFEDRKIY